MNITFKIKLSKVKDTNYVFNLDMDPERIESDEKESTQAYKEIPKIELGPVKRPSLDRLNILKHPDLREEERATEEVMDKLEL